MEYVKLDSVIKKANTGADAIKRAPIVPHDSGLRCLRIQDISQNKPFQKWGFTEVSDADLQRFLLKKDDILIARTGATIGANLIIAEDMHAVFNNGLIRLKVNTNKCDPRYLALNIGSSTFSSYMDNVARTTSTQPNIKIGVLLRFTFPLPTISVQNKIAAVLDSYSNLIANNNVRISMLDDFANQLYREWFVRLRFPGRSDSNSKGRIPEGWNEIPFAAMCTFVKGKNPRDIFETRVDESFPYMTVSHLEGKNPTYVIPATNSVICNDGDVLMLMDGARSGLVFRAEQGVVGSTFAIVKTKTHLRNFVYEYLRAGQDAIVFNNTGSAIPHASKDFINKMILRMPSESGLIDEFNSQYEMYRRAMEKLAACNSILGATYERLRNRLLGGTLAVNDLDIQLPSIATPLNVTQQLSKELVHA